MHRPTLLRTSALLLGLTAVLTACPGGMPTPDPGDVPPVTPPAPPPDPPPAPPPAAYDPHDLSTKTNAVAAPAVVQPPLSGLPQDVTGYQEHNRTMFQGDIIAFPKGTAPKLQVYGAARLALPWANSTIPYVIDSSLAAQTALVEEAVAHFNARVGTVTWTPRTTQANFVRFQTADAGDCSSYIGMVGGEQPIHLGAGCARLPTVLHEMGHAAGLFHEQSRSDRDDHVRVLYDNIPEAWRPQYAKFADATPSGAYDYYSLMHYSMFWGSKPAMEPQQSGIDLNKVGHAEDLSTTDVLSIRLIHSPNNENFTPPQEHLMAGQSLTVGGPAAGKSGDYVFKNPRGAICSARIVAVETRGQKYNYRPTGYKAADAVGMHLDVYAGASSARLYIEMWGTTVDPTWSDAVKRQNCPYVRNGIIFSSTGSR